MQPWITYPFPEMHLLAEAISTLVQPTAETDYVTPVTMKKAMEGKDGEIAGCCISIHNRWPNEYVLRVQYTHCSTYSTSPSRCDSKWYEN